MEPTVKRQKLSIMNTDQNEKASTSMGTVEDSIDLFTSQYARLEKKSWYVDKTLFIKAVFQTTPGLLISAPRRFMKSTNMDMLKKFLEIEVNEQGLPIKNQLDEKGDQVKLQNRILFKDKNIFKLEEQFFKDHFGCYPVIYVDFKGVDGDSLESVLNAFRTILYQSFREHSYLLKSKICLEAEKDTSKFIKYVSDVQHKELDEEEIRTGLKYLSKLLYEYFNKKVYVLIDEYDAPVSRAIYHNDNREDMNKTIKFIQSFISESLKDNVYVHGALMNACNHIGGILSPPGNSITHYPFLSKRFCRFYGFTGVEVEHLLQNLSVEQINDVKNWYNGYSATDANGSSVEIYSNWSILNYLDDGKIDSYWASCSLHHFENILLHDRIQGKIQKLIHGHIVSINYRKTLELTDVETLKKFIHSPSPSITSEDVELFIQFLYENGYLNVESEFGEQLKLKIPNLEIHHEFCSTLFSLDFFIRHYHFEKAAMDKCIELLKCVSQNKRQEDLFQLAQGIKNLYCNSPMIPHREFEFQAHLFYLLRTGFPKIMGHAFTAPKGKFRCDLAVVLIEKEITGIIFELKLKREDSESALKLILENKYYTIFEKERYAAISNTILIGLHMSECKEITISYLINNFDVNNIKTVSTLI